MKVYGFRERTVADCFKFPNKSFNLANHISNLNAIRSSGGGINQERKTKIVLSSEFGRIIRTGNN